MSHYRIISTPTRTCVLLYISGVNFFSVQAVPQGPRLCVRSDCDNPIKATRERGAQYCSNECLVLYCRYVLTETR